ncbi:hypothetical protein ACHAXH_000003 [Discostella pseudostelligera]
MTMTSAAAAAADTSDEIRGLRSTSRTLWDEEVENREENCGDWQRGHDGLGMLAGGWRGGYTNLLPRRSLQRRRKSENNITSGATSTSLVLDLCSAHVW